MKIVTLHGELLISMPYPEIQRLLPAICCPILLAMAFRLYVLGITGRLGHSSLNGTVPALGCFVAACTLGALAIVRPTAPTTQVVSIPVSAPDPARTRTGVEVATPSSQQLVPLKPVDKIVFAVPTTPAATPITGSLPAPLEGSIRPRRRVLTAIAPPRVEPELPAPAPTVGKPMAKHPDAPPKDPKVSEHGKTDAPTEIVPTGPVDDIGR